MRFQTPRTQPCRHHSTLSFQAVIAFDFNTVIVKYLARSSFAKGKKVLIFFSYLYLPWRHIASDKKTKRRLTSIGLELFKIPKRQKQTWQVYLFFDSSKWLCLTKFYPSQLSPIVRQVVRHAIHAPKLNTIFLHQLNEKQKKTVLWSPESKIDVVYSFLEW